jgi:hypothetical protein
MTQRAAVRQVATRLVVLAGGRVLPAAAGFLLGALVGLVVLGWWLLPVRWTDVGPAQLAPAWQAELARLVASDYARTGDDRAAWLALDPLEPAQRVQLLASVAADQDPVVSQAAAALAALAADPLTADVPEGPAAPAPPAAAPAADADSETAARDEAAAAARAPGAPPWRRWSRTAAHGALAVSASLAAILLLAAWRQRRGAAHSRAGSSMPGTSAGHSRRVPTGIATRAGLGQRLTFAYRPNATPPHTWLVYGRDDTPVGDVECCERRVGRRRALDVIVHGRSEPSGDLARAQLALLAAEDVTDPLLGSVLGAAAVLVAEPGRTAVLEAGLLSVGVTVHQVDAPGDPSEPGLTGVVLLFETALVADTAHSGPPPEEAPPPASRPPEATEPAPDAPD